MKVRCGVALLFVLLSVHSFWRRMRNSSLMISSSKRPRPGDAALVASLLDKGLTSMRSFGMARPPCSKAAERGHAKVVKVLLDRGAGCHHSRLPSTGDGDDRALDS
jgi:hypothetical protein